VAQGSRGFTPTTLFLLCYIQTLEATPFSLALFRVSSSCPDVSFNFTVYLMLWFQSTGTILERLPLRKLAIIFSSASLLVRGQVNLVVLASGVFQLSVAKIRNLCVRGPNFESLRCRKPCNANQSLNVGHRTPDS